jgi:hypothetical protein
MGKKHVLTTGCAGSRIDHIGGSNTGGLYLHTIRPAKITHPAILRIRRDENSVIIVVYGIFDNPVNLIAAGADGRTDDDNEVFHLGRITLLKPTDRRGRNALCRPPPPGVDGGNNSPHRIEKQQGYAIRRFHPYSHSSPVRDDPVVLPVSSVTGGDFVINDENPVFMNLMDRDNM